MTKAAAWTGGAFIALYVGVLCSQLDHGLASLDAHGIVRSVHTLIEHHRIDVSRPPGHPTTEFYLFGAAAWLLSLFGLSFGERAYLLGQVLAAAATLALFYELLGRLRVRPWQACLAVVALGLSAQFFANAVDGEEFLFALFFVLLAVRLLIVDPPVRLLRLVLSIAAFALATGCRPEIVFAIGIYPLYLWSARADRSRFAFTAVALLIALVLVWWPVLVAGMSTPYAAGMTMKQALLVGEYKLVFQCFGVVVFALLVIGLACAFWKWPARWRSAFPQNFTGTLACALPVLYFALFFRYPTKPAYVLVALPFLLAAATEWPPLLLALVAFSALELFVRIDIFWDRRLTFPFMTRGSGIAAIEQKPFYRLSYLRGVAGQCGDGRSLIVADAAPWDFSYHIARGTFRAEEKSVGLPRIPAFVPAGAPSCLLFPRDAAFAHKAIEGWRERGYRLKMDATLYRTAFGRYEIDRPDDTSAFELFSVKP